MKIFIIFKNKFNVLQRGRIEMYIIIMGGGRVGLNLANLLIEDGHDITLIERDESLCS